MDSRLHVKNRRTSEHCIRLTVSPGEILVLTARWETASGKQFHHEVAGPPLNRELRAWESDDVLRGLGPASTMRCSSC